MPEFALSHPFNLLVEYYSDGTMTIVPDANHNLNEVVEKGQVSTWHWPPWLLAWRIEGLDVEAPQHPPPHSGCLKGADPP